MRYSWVLALLVGAAACHAPSADSPPEVRYGRDACARCGMILSEAAYASGYRVGSQTVVYDDLGELLAAAAQDERIGRAAWVHDLEDGSWLKASGASFVKVESLSTPMGSGVAAFKTRERAARFAASRRAAAPLTWQQALRERAQRS